MESGAHAGAAGLGATEAPRGVQRCTVAGADRRRQCADVAERLSVIIPSYNSASMLGDAIESVLAQTRAVDAIFVVDDGSADETATVCGRYGPRVTYLWQRNAGASAARNTAIAAAVAAREGAAAARSTAHRAVAHGDAARGAVAHGDSARGAVAHGHWLAFLDADDLWMPDKIERQLAALAAAPADFCVTAALAWSAAEGRYYRTGWRGPADATRIRRELLVRNVLSGLCSSLVVREDVLLAVGGFAAGKAAEDRRLGIELLARHRPLVMEVPLVRQRPGPAHWTNPERHRAEMLRLVADYEALYRELSPSGLLRRRAMGRIHERSGMHYLENGDLRAARHDLVRAVWHWPFAANPWRVAVNAMLGRLKMPAAADGAGGALQTK